MQWASRHGQSMLKHAIRGMSIPVSKMFGISPRAIRDIWNRRTWEHATADLWELETFVEETEASLNEVLFSRIDLIHRSDHHSAMLLVSPDFDSHTQQVKAVRQPGRPRGSRDKHPRMKKQTRDQMSGATRSESCFDDDGKQRRSRNNVVAECVLAVCRELSDAPLKCPALTVVDSTHLQCRIAEDFLLSGIVGSSSFEDPFHEDWQHCLIELQSMSSL